MTQYAFKKLIINAFQILILLTLITVSNYKNVTNRKKYVNIDVTNSHFHVITLSQNNT